MLAATGGLSRNSFWSGSSRFSKALDPEASKHLITALVNEPSRSCSSTFAVSSWSLQKESAQIRDVGFDHLPSKDGIERRDLPIRI